MQTYQHMRAYNGREVSEEVIRPCRLKEEALTRPRREKIVFSSELRVPRPWIRRGDMVRFGKEKPCMVGVLTMRAREVIGHHCGMRLRR